MKVETLDVHPVDISTLQNAETFDKWVNGDISNAFYLGFMRREYAKEIEDIRNSRVDESGIVLLKSIDGNVVKAKPYFKEIAELLKPYLEDEKGFVILDAVNGVLEKVQPTNEDDIYSIAYVLGVYMDSLYRRQAADA